MGEIVYVVKTNLYQGIYMQTHLYEQRDIWSHKTFIWSMSAISQMPRLCNIMAGAAKASQNRKIWFRVSPSIGRRWLKYVSPWSTPGAHCLQVATCVNAGWLSGGQRKIWRSIITFQYSTSLSCYSKVGQPGTTALKWGVRAPLCHLHKLRHWNLSCYIISKHMTMIILTKFLARPLSVTASKNANRRNRKRNDNFGIHKCLLLGHVCRCQQDDVDWMRSFVPHLASVYFSTIFFFRFIFCY